LDAVVIIGASAAVVSATVGVTILWLTLRWHRPLLTISFFGPRRETPERLAFTVSIRNDGDRTVRDVQAQALVDGKPLADTPLAGSWTIAPHQPADGDLEIARGVLGDPPDLNRLAARVSYADRRRRKHKDVACGERNATLS
jgi:hypothetical protein